MKILNIYKLKNIIRVSLPIIIGWLLCHGSVYAVALINDIDVDSTPGVLRVGLSEHTQFKILKLDAREIMVAFKSSDLLQSITTEHTGHHPMNRVTLNRLPNQVVTITVNTDEDIKSVNADWQDDFKILIVRFDIAGDDSGDEIPVKRRKFIKDKQPATPTGAVENDTQKPKDTKSETTLPATQSIEAVSNTSSMETTSSPEVVEVPLTELNEQGSATKEEADIDGLIREMLQNGCSQSSRLDKALAHGRRNEWKQTFDLLGAVLNPAAEEKCQAELYYLRAYAAYKMNRAGDDQLYLDTVNYFQDAISYFSESSYVPYALLALGSIYDELDNTAEAIGYYKNVLKSYPDHPVYAVGLFRLGQLYAREQKQSRAIAAFRQFMEAFPKSPRLTAARQALGKSLYETGEFAESRAILTAIIEEDPSRVYQDSDLLIYLGDLNYQLGHPKDAREAMIKAVNLYAGSDAVPVLLTQIADTYRDEGQTDQAKKMYQLVMETYPKTDGFAVSALRYAELLPDPEEKEAQYRMVIEGFPEHPMAKLAIVRLADLQVQAGAFSAAIDTLQDISLTGLKDLKNEADYVMASSFDGLFKQLSGQDDPIAVITAYEKDKHLINRLQNASIFSIVGTAFLDAYLYRQAAELLQKSYKLSSSDSRSPDLYYRLGVAFQETGKDMQAREMLDVYFEKDPNGQKHSDAFLRMGRLLSAEKKWDRALAVLSAGIGQSDSDPEKADILFSQAEVNQALGKDAAVPSLLIRAINLLASSPEVRKEQLVQAHRFLGESYLKLSSFEKAIDAFTMALKFSETDRAPSLLFLLGESNMKASRTEAAMSVFNEIIDSGDVFWSRMARERLQTMALESKLEL